MTSISTTIKKTLWGKTPWIVLLLVSLITVEACSYHEDLLLVDEEEFVLQPGDLDNYLNWTVRGSEERVDLNQYRTVYVNKPEEAFRENDNYSTGTIIVKEVRKFSDRDRIMRFQVMVKRGGNFNLTGRGWEWLLVPADDLSDLSLRGDRAFSFENGSNCHNCHAPENDLVFNVYIGQ